MIELYRAAEDPEGERIEEALRECAAAYRVVLCSIEQARAVLGAEAELPAIREGERVVWGASALREFLEEHARTLEEWRKFQTDACYLDDEGRVC